MATASDKQCNQFEVQKVWDYMQGGGGSGYQQGACWTIADMIGEALKAAEIALSSTTTACKGKVDNSAADKQAREAAVVQVSAQLERLVADTAAKKSALDEASKALKAAKAVTSEAKKVQSAGDAVLDTAEAKKARLVEAVSQDLAPLKVRAAGASKEDKVSLKKLAAIGKEFSFDASMLEILPKAVKKEPADRGPFDAITLEKFEEQCHAAVAAIDAELAAGAPGHKCSRSRQRRKKRQRAKSN